MFYSLTTVGGHLEVTPHLTRQDAFRHLLIGRDLSGRGWYIDVPGRGTPQLRRDGGMIDYTAEVVDGERALVNWARDADREALPAILAEIRRAISAAIALDPSEG